MNHRNHQTLRTILLAAAFAVLSTTSQAQIIYYLQQNHGNTDWTTNTGIWFTNPVSGGSNPTPSGQAAAFTGHYFDLNGFGLVATNGVNTFPGALLTLNGGFVRIRAETTVTNATATGGTVLFNQDGLNLTFNFTNLNNASGTTILRTDAGGANSLNVNIGTLTGSGNFALDTTSSPSNNKTIFLSATNASAWTGNIGWLDADQLTLDFGNDAVFGGSLTAPLTARITLDQDVTFAAVTLAGVSLDPGTYSYAVLSTHGTYGTIFNAGGSGSITVVPEPGTLALLGLGGLLVFKRRRKSSLA